MLTLNTYFAAKAFNIALRHGGPLVGEVDPPSSNARQDALYHRLSPAAGVAVYFASWPYLYIHPWHNLKAYWQYIFSAGGSV